MYQIKLIHRRKLRGLGQHYGVLFDDGAGLPPEVYDRQPEGIRRVSLEEFASGRPVFVGGVVATPIGVLRARNRLEEELALDANRQGGRFNLLSRNCEHLARYIVSEERRSSQISGLVLIGAVVMAVCVLHDN